ncbi:glycoside hydrolase family 32 protein [Domibacillus sp. DTU_2020_1001157_1_SI_ALB_TIR_016]|uniref:glycoside hydrolase family 32 protein n=1 Tax=Domibacillus sp. DTU_2020_1001157_1_SI_ALB_TIR_016 TaxID=3077789 RepID=UPI0028F0E43E|nr:glycoside hydrolase family 32 protein [Domibacillus sp. DTU_2020_1001157_1_SI_ALB_TIR_016]WNS78930.1 glycoside hydrolase family 32 protein [Domibacillus sp. DTU_2020_1001157_1_SI_ALB_TIR_016]
MTQIPIKDVYYTEPYRPQFHYSPESNWLNDPNGMVYYNGEYHLFYQYHPHGTTWGPMHWGHAVSSDLVSWEHLPVALEPDSIGAIFSGSAVVDWQDTTGFFDGESGLVAIFTHAGTYPDSDRPRQVQSIAYSKDNGRTWQLYEGNPVLSDESKPDFRDPKVFWHTETNRWVMVLATGQTISIYTSPNLKEWTFASEFGENQGFHEGVWECPDLFELPVDGDPSASKWVLLVSVGDHPHLAEGSRTQYFIGEFNGTAFSNEHSEGTTLWLDYGRDNYAGVSWSDIPHSDSRRVYIGWMSNWKYANLTPSTKWRGAMTLPRTLSLASSEQGIRLVQSPVEELKALRSQSILLKENEDVDQTEAVYMPETNTYELEAEFQIGDTSVFGFSLCTSSTEKTIVGYDVKSEQLFMDRTASGQVDFHEGFAAKHQAVLSPKEGKIKLRIFVDWSSVEVFANDGEIAMTDLIFPDSDSRTVELFIEDGKVTLVSLIVHPLQTIWK